jgi:hypothetical protein
MNFAAPKADGCCSAIRATRRAARKIPTVSLFAFADPEHFGAAGWAHTLGSGSAVFHRNFLGILHFFFGFAFHTISLHFVPPLIFLNPQNISRDLSVANKFKRISF